MTPTAWLLLLIVLLLDTGSHLLLKSASMRAKARETQRGGFMGALLREPALWLAIPAFVGLFFSWIAFISTVPLSQGVMAGSITIAGVMIGGRLVFDERITRERGLAIALVALGVAFVGWGA